MATGVGKNLHTAHLFGLGRFKGEAIEGPGFPVNDIAVAIYLDLELGFQ